MGVYITGYNKKCSHCGKEFSMFFYDIKDYVYKVQPKNGNVKYQCSYPCYRKEKEKNENSGKTSKRASRASR